MFAVNKLRFVASSKFSVLAKSSLSSVKFVASHEYIKLVGDIGTVGITQHAADALGDVVYVELPSVGSKYTAGSSFGSVESVKAASDVYVPVTGEVVAVNTELTSNPSLVNESPLEKGWFIQLKLGADGKAEFSKLMDEAAYKKHVDESQH